jgi:hypothetical protein
MSGTRRRTRSRSLEAQRIRAPTVSRKTVETPLTYGVVNAYAWWELLIPQTPLFPTLMETRDGNLHKVQCAWVQTVDICFRECPNSVPACLGLGKATRDFLESQEVVELINRIIARVYRPYRIRADRKRRNSFKWISNLVEITRRKIEAKDIGAALCSPDFAAVHVYFAKGSVLLIEIVPAKVVTEDLST